MKLHSYFAFCYVENILKDQLSKQAVGSFTNGVSGPKRFWDFRETGPRGERDLCRMQKSVRIFGLAFSVWKRNVIGRLNGLMG